MSDFTIRSESVDVEQIMKQIRARIAEKRGVDYTEEQIRELAAVRLEKFLDPKNLRSDLLEQFRKSRPAVNVEPPVIEPPYAFDDQTLFTSHRGGMRFIRKLLMPILKLFFNPNTLNQVLHTQAQFNTDILKREARRKIEFDQSRAEWNSLYYEVLHNLVLETTRTSIEVKNLKMRVESLSSRLDFSERRVRALEGVVQYRPEAVRGRERERREPPPEAAAGAALEGVVTTEAALVPAGAGTAPASTALGEGSTRRRRRRRRGRRGAGATTAGGGEGETSNSSEGAADSGGDDDGFDGADEGDTFEATPETDAPPMADEPSDPNAQ